MKNNGNVGKAGASFTFMGMNIPRTALIGMIVILVVFAALGVGGYLLYTNDNYYSTDDAQVTGNIVNIDAIATGTLNTLTVNVGDFVRTDEVIGTVKIQGSYATESLEAQFSGVIVQVPGVVGQIVGPGIAIVQEGDPSSIKVTAYVDESAMNNISVGQLGDIHVDAYNGTTFSGHVSQIVGAAAEQFSLLPTQDNASGNFTKVSQRIPVNILLDGNPGFMLLPGMSTEVTIHLHGV
jgi:multidrug resistance efflux pump